ncbi:MAG: hypothetical protein R3C11_04095 [Planctomycetaceae bacterium]
MIHSVLQQVISKTGRLCLPLLLLMVLLSASVEAARDSNLEFDLETYAVNIQVLFQDQSEIPPALRQQVLNRLNQLNESTYGELWKQEVSENKTFLPRTSEALTRTSPEQLKKDFPADTWDKVYLCYVARNGFYFDVFVREWDCVLESFSLVEQEQVFSIDEVPATINSLFVRTFRPLAKVTKLDKTDRKVYLTLRGGEFPTPDASAAQVVSGDVFLPALRYMDKNNQVQKIQFFDWNYFRVEEIDRGRIVCSVISGVQTPIGGRGLRRIEQYGMRIRPLRSSTEIRLSKFNQPNIPLVAHYVSSFLKNSYRDEAIEEPIRYLSNRQGVIDIPLRKEHPVQWLYINSGSALLGRVPVVPGITEHIECPLPDDSTRLEVEGQIEQLKGRIVELIAMRSSIMAEIKVAALKNKWDEVDALLPRLDELDTAEELKGQLNTIRVLPMQEAERLGNKVGARRIDALARKTAPFIDKYLGSKAIESFKDQIEADRASAQKAAEEAAARKAEEEAAARGE